MTLIVASSPQRLASPLNGFYYNATFPAYSPNGGVRSI
jgi:hypothetical protein